jgi:lysophospholipase L1-like esterase
MPVTVYKAAYGSPSNALETPSILVVGDSIASQNDSMTFQTTGTTSVAITRFPKAIGWLDCLTSGALNYDSTVNPVTGYRMGSNAGFGGLTTAGLLAKLTIGDAFTGNAPLVSRPEKYFIIVIGTNDINSGTVTLASMISNVTEIARAIVAHNKYPIFTTILPRNAVDGANDWSASGLTTAQKRLMVASYNRWLRDFCRDNGYKCISWDGVFSTTAGDAVTGYTADGVHPSQLGGWYQAHELLRQLSDIIPKSVGGSQNGYDVYDATYNPYGNWLNGSLTGTAGVTSDAGGTGTITGAIPSNFQIRKETSTTTSVVSSIVARPDGLPGNAWRLVFTSAGTGAATEEWRLNYWTGASTTLAGFMAADEVYGMECEFSVEAGHNGVLKSPQVRLGENSGVTVTGSTISFNAATNTINDSANGLAGFQANRLINVAGSVSNNRTFLVTGVTAGSLTVSTSTPVTQESAGASVTLRLPSYSWVTSASTERFPNVATGTFLHRIPTAIGVRSVNCSPRLAIFINGTISGTATIYVMRPCLYKEPFRPSVLNYTASDN